MAAALQWQPRLERLLIVLTSCCTTTLLSNFSAFWITTLGCASVLRILRLPLDSEVYKDMPWDLLIPVSDFIVTKSAKGTEDVR